MKVAIASNTNLGLLLDGLRGDHQVYAPPGHGNWVRDLSSPESPMESFAPDVVFLLLDGAALVRGARTRAEVDEAVETALAYLDGHLRMHPDRPLFASTLDLPHDALTTLKAPRLERHAEGAWNRGLEGLCAKHPRCYPFEFKELVERIGRVRFYSAKLEYAGGIRFSLAAHRQIERAVRGCLGCLAGARRKLLVVDLDGTLWGGVLGEDGPDGVVLSSAGEGARFKDLQQRVLELKESGVLLAIASKNNAADVREIFQSHPDMVLELEDFAATRIDWGVKAENIADILSDLDIGADAAVFIDDSPVERAAVAQLLPEVAVPAFPDDTTALSGWMREVRDAHFLSADITDEDRRKTEQYRENEARTANRDAAPSYEAFLASLETVVSVRLAGRADAPRVAQLTGKTNQFNLTTRRYGETGILDLLASQECWVVVASVEDRFGASGLVAVVIATRDGAAADIDTFLLSCRVMSRFVEDTVLTATERFLAKQGIRQITARYLPTGRNAPVSHLMERLGYEVLRSESSGAKHYQRDLTGIAPPGRRFFADLVDELDAPRGDSTGADGPALAGEA